MEPIKTPTEHKTEHIEYVLHKYLNGLELWKVIYSKLSDDKLEKLLKDIKEG